MNCYDCTAPAHEDEGYYFQGQLVCHGCYEEAVFMALIELDPSADTRSEGEALSYVEYNALVLA